jgi:RHS repeat-associated protein
MNRTEYKLYYFNANHLGSGSLITDINGDTYQTLAYAPFGEILVNQFSGDYDEPYKFTGYERDTESGLDYMGARYRNVEATIPLSPDRFWFKTPHLSPYNFAANNPISYIDVNGDSIDIGTIKALDNRYNTNYYQTIVNDLQSQTGLSLSMKSNGMLIYDKDAAITGGSETARNHLIDLISNTSGTISVGLSNQGSKGLGNTIWLDPAQITNFIANTVNVDSRTLGWGMTFLHESYHTTLGGGLFDPSDNTDFLTVGPVVERMNIIRAELNAQGGNYGQRMSYYGIPSVTNYSYLPFSDLTRIALIFNFTIRPELHKFIKTR